MNLKKYVFKILILFSLVLFQNTGFAQETQNDSEVHEIGITSYYHDKFQGQKTSNGERYNKNALTAAHHTLPFGTILHVVNLENNQSVNVRVNSRPHYANPRILDLSKRAAKEIGILKQGLAEVEITVVSLGDV